MKSFAFACIAATAAARFNNLFVSKALADSIQITEDLFTDTVNGDVNETFDDSVDGTRKLSPFTNLGFLDDGCNHTNIPKCEDPMSLYRQVLGYTTYTLCMSSIGCFNYIDPDFGKPVEIIIETNPEEVYVAPVQTDFVYVAPVQTDFVDAEPVQTEPVYVEEVLIQPGENDKLFKFLGFI